MRWRDSFSLSSNCKHYNQREQGTCHSDCCRQDPNTKIRKAENQGDSHRLEVTPPRHLLTANGKRQQRTLPRPHEWVERVKCYKQ